MTFRFLSVLIGRLSSPQEGSNLAISQLNITFNEVLKRFNANVPYSGLINAVTSDGKHI